MICGLLALSSQIFFWLLSVSFGVAVLLAVFSGFAYLLAFGNTAMQARVKRALKTTIVGFALCLMAWLAIHALYTVLGYQGSWWWMECASGEPGAAEEKNNDPYANEISPDSSGGRNNPVSLPDLAQQGLQGLPDNKYFFIHGLGGQPLASSAEQLARLIEEAKKQGKSVYAVIPYRDPATGIIIGSNLLNMNNYIGFDTEQTVANVRNLIVQLIAESPTAKFAFITESSNGQIAKFNNVWPDEIDPEKGLSTFTADGVLYKEKEINTRQDEDAPGNSYFTINLTYDPKTDSYSLNRDNPLTFDFPPNVSLAAAKSAAIDIAQVVAEASKYSQNMSKDQWDQFVNLLYKDPKFLAGFSSDSDSTFSSSAWPSGVEVEKVEKLEKINPGQTAIMGRLEQAEKDLDRISKSVIDDELGRPTTRISKSPIAKVDTPKNTTDTPSAVETTPSSASPTGQQGGYNPVPPSDLPDSDWVALPKPNQGSSRKGQNNQPATQPGTPSLVQTSPSTQSLIDSFDKTYIPPPIPTDNSEDLISPSRRQNSTGSARSSGAGTTGTSGTSTLPPIPSGTYTPTSPESPPTGSISSVQSYDPSQLSRIRGKITTDNILSLSEREDIRNMLLGIQKEMAEEANKRGEKGMNVPVDLQMCLFYKETFHHTINSQGKKEPESFDASAQSTSRCAGLGQLEMKSAKYATPYLKKYAPQSFKELSDKVQEDFNVDLEKTMTDDKYIEKRREILRRDPNLNAAISYALTNVKRRDGWGGKPIGNTGAKSSELRSLASSYGPGDTGEYADPSYANLVMDCYQNDSWRKISEAGQQAIDKRLGK